LAIKQNKKKVCLISLGCPKNLVDSEVMLGALNKNEYEITCSEIEADIIIINTCCFIEDAKVESINAILKATQLSEGSEKKILIVAGCLAERYNNEIIKEIPEVDGVVGTGYCEKISEVIDMAYEDKKPVLFGNFDYCNYNGVNRIVSTPKGYAYLKIAEGCDNHCTYCVIPFLKGCLRSRRLEDILCEAEHLVQCGAKEIIIVAQDTTAYGKDIYNGKKLALLLQELEKIDRLKWIRILYCYPDEIDDELLEEIARNPKVCKYFDIPVQHISDKILKKMGRRGSGNDIESLIEKIRNRIPEAVIRTSIMVGFPGEEDYDFSLLTSFIKKTGFDNLGVFIYSEEEGTPAANFKNNVTKKIKRERYKKIMLMQKEIAEAKSKTRINKTYEVLIEGTTGNGKHYYGRSYAEAPDIDGIIYFNSDNPLKVGNFVNVKIIKSHEYDLIGVVENESAK